MGCCGPRHHLVKADGTQDVAVPRNGLPIPAQAVSGAASGFQKQGDVTPAYSGCFSRERALVFFSGATEARFWCKSRKSQVLPNARQVAPFIWLGLHRRLQGKMGDRPAGGCLAPPQSPGDGFENTLRHKQGLFGSEPAGASLEQARLCAPRCT